MGGEVKKKIKTYKTTNGFYREVQTNIQPHTQIHTIKRNIMNLKIKTPTIHKHVCHIPIKSYNCNLQQ